MFFLGQAVARNPDLDVPKAIADIHAIMNGAAWSQQDKLNDIRAYINKQTSVQEQIQ